MPKYLKVTTQILLISYLPSIKVEFRWKTIFYKKGTKNLRVARNFLNIVWMYYFTRDSILQISCNSQILAPFFKNEIQYSSF